MGRTHARTHAHTHTHSTTTRQPFLEGCNADKVNVLFKALETIACMSFCKSRSALHSPAGCNLSQSGCAFASEGVSVNITLPIPTYVVSTKAVLLYYLPPPPHTHTHTHICVCVCVQSCAYFGDTGGAVIRVCRHFQSLSALMADSC